MRSAVGLDGKTTEGSERNAEKGKRQREREREIKRGRERGIDG